MEDLWHTAPTADRTYGLFAGLRAVAAGWRTDAGVSLTRRLARLLRRARVLRSPLAHAVVAGSAAFAAHLAALDEPDALVFLARRHYLARGLRAGERMAAAAAHYGHEDRTFGPAYHHAVYRGGGLLLWQSDCRRYSIRLEHGHDVLVEGGASLVLRADGARICVLSYSWVPRRVVDPEGTAGLPPFVHFVARKQHTHDYAYQAAFHHTFDRVTPGHLCFAAMEGLVLACGGRTIVGVRPEAHPAFSPDHAPAMTNAYDGFWQTLGAEPLSRIAVRIPLPVVLPPLEEMAAGKRRRALARRAHLDSVRAAARAALAPHLLQV